MFLHPKDVSCDVEAAGPVANTSAWGAPLIERTSSKLPQEAHQAQRLESRHVKESLAVEAKALFTSLRQLHSLMSGPRGSELKSPTGAVSDK